MKKVLISSVLGLLVLGGAGAAIWKDDPANAKQQAKQVDAKQLMAKYSPPNEKAANNNTVRVSRLKEMNIVGEAATVLNVLPIDIIDKMKQGKTIAQIAKEKGLSEQQFTQKINDLETKKVNDAVKDGTITKEHAEAITQGRTDRLKKGLKEKAMNVNEHKAMDMGN
jgi:hypothetical protein